jgi:hypothetical protein
MRKDKSLSRDDTLSDKQCVIARAGLLPLLRQLMNAHLSLSFYLFLLGMQAGISKRTARRETSQALTMAAEGRNSASGVFWSVCN